MTSKVQWQRFGRGFRSCRYVIPFFFLNYILDVNTMLRFLEGYSLTEPTTVVAYLLEDSYVLAISLLATDVGNSYQLNVKAIGTFDHESLKD